MTFSDAIGDGFSKYAEFSGRSSRSAFWWWTLFYFLVIIGASILDGIVNTPAISGLTWLALFLPNLAVTVRRLHDIDHSGWWVLIGLVPLVGWIILIVFACTGSGPPNRYGAGPDGSSGMTATSHLGQALPPPPPPAPESPPRSDLPPPAASERAPD